LIRQARGGWRVRAHQGPRAGRGPTGRCRRHVAGAASARGNRRARRLRRASGKRRGRPQGGQQADRGCASTVFSFAEPAHDKPWAPHRPRGGTTARGLLTPQRWAPGHSRSPWPNGFRAADIGGAGPGPRDHARHGRRARWLPVRISTGTRPQASHGAPADTDSLTRRGSIPATAWGWDTTSSEIGLKRFALGRTRPRFARRSSWNQEGKKKEKEELQAGSGPSAVIVQLRLRAAAGHVSLDGRRQPGAIATLVTVTWRAATRRAWHTDRPRRRAVYAPGGAAGGAGARAAARPPAETRPDPGSPPEPGSKRRR